MALIDIAHLHGIANGDGAGICCFPTTDIDVNTLRALEDALENFAGCVLIISHDRWFLDRLATHILSFEDDAEVVFFEGSFSDYEEAKKARLGDITPHRPRVKHIL